MSLVSFSRAASVVAFGILASGSAFAACTSPAGTAGDINYSTNNIMAYCNGTVWVNMGTNLSIGFGVLTTGDFCIATSGTQISCNIATINLSSQASGTLQTAQFPALTGDVTTSAGSLATSIGANAVTMGKIAQIAGLSVIGNSASGTGNVAAITGTANQTLIVNGAGTGLAFGALNLASSAAVTGILPVSNGGTGDFDPDAIWGAAWQRHGRDCGDFGRRNRHGSDRQYRREPKFFGLAQPDESDPVGQGIFDARHGLHDGRIASRREFGSLFSGALQRRGDGDFLRDCGRQQRADSLSA